MPNRLSAYTSQVSVNIAEKCFILERAADLEALWDAMSHESGDAELDEDSLPYWTEVWPASVALAQWLVLQKQHIAHKICLDLGCGLGLTAMVGQWMQARVVGMDLAKQALYFAKKNAELNDIAQPLWAVMDWRRPAVRPRSIDFLWGGDIMYERRFVQPVLQCIDTVLQDNGRAWIAEPCRSVYEFFRKELYARNWHAKRVYETTIEPIYAQPASVTVHVWELRRP